MTIAAGIAFGALILALLRRDRKNRRTNEIDDLLDEFRKGL